MKAGAFQGWRPDTKKEIPLGHLVNAFGRTQSQIDEYFADGGPIAKVFPGNYHRRAAQVNLAQMVWRALEQRRTLMAEAETGTGKSFAMLVPAILWALQYQRTVLVSTATIALQDQYCRKDLPMLERAFAEAMGLDPGDKDYVPPFRWAKAQGRSNFYCEAAEGAGFDFAAENDSLAEWLQVTQTGDFNELPFDIKSPRLAKFWEANRADSEDCPGAKKCPMGEQCWFYRAKAQQEGAHIIIVNHALLALNDRLEGQILPGYQALLVDEAHQLERYVRGAWEATLSPQRCFRLGAKLAKAGLDGQEVLDQAGKALGEFFEDYLRPFGEAPTVEFFPKKWPQHWSDWQSKRAQELKDLIDTLVCQAEDIPKAGPLCGALMELARDLERVGLADQAARWFERDRAKRPVLKISPVDVSAEMARLYQVPTVLTSATLAIGESYEFAATEMGVSSPLEMPPLKSPFDWDKCCLYAYPKKGYLLEEDLKARRGETPRQTARRWAGRISGPIKHVLERTSGRAFVLFTSRAAMEETYDLVAPHCRELGWDVFIQGELSKAETVARFKAGTSPVLFATSSFWEGVDIPGSQLSAVIIDKLPFPSPSSPIEKAKSELLGFSGYNIPMVVRALKQGVGRLIRSAEDRGVVCILDPRVRKYARQIIAHLPGKAVEALDGAQQPITQFLDGTGQRGPVGELEEWASRGLLLLSGLDSDRASERNDVGFNGADTEFGNSLAEQLAARGLTSRQWALACTMLRKYWRQIGPAPEPTVDQLLQNLDEEAA